MLKMLFCLSAPQLDGMTDIISHLGFALVCCVSFVLSVHRK